jgi:NAD(P)H dehydrogenase (quinone)
MAKVLIVYATDYGNTKKMAESFFKGVSSVKGAEPIMQEAEKASKEAVRDCDALVLGTPVHMGACDWRIKKFIDTICSALWMKDVMVGRVGAVFASGSGFGNSAGGAELALLSMLNNLVELGLIIIPLPKNTEGYDVAGLQWGPYGRSAGIHMEQTGVGEEQLVSSFHHGKQVARATLHLKGNKIFSKE